MVVREKSFKFFLDVRIGPEVITDPAYLVTRNLEDFITWTNGSNIKKSILQFNEEFDDYTQF
jgi:U3 small nucleolar ribonucleoprotein protein IMP3